MAKRRRKRIASRGSVNNTILKTLINGDKYGYEIIKEVEEFSDGKIKLKQPSLYSSLSRFEEKGFVTSYWGDSDIGGRRHYYHLTESGIKYYEKEVLKLGRDEDIEDDEDLEELVETEIKEEDEEITASEIDEDEIPSIVDFPEKKEEVIIPDHQFYRQTPIERSVDSDKYEEQYVIKKAPSEYSEPVTLSIHPVVETPTIEKAEPVMIEEEEIEEDIIEETESPKPWEALANTAKANNSKASSTALKKLHYNKPPTIKGKKVILDKDGIYKLRDSDYDPNKHTENKKPVIIDNVIKRTNPNNVYGYTAYAEQSPKKPTPTSTVELTDEERKARNESFLAKFNSISRTKQKDKEDEELSKTYLHKLDMLKSTSEQEERKPTPPPSYEPIITRSILDEEDEEEEIYEETTEQETNSLFDYEEVDDFVDLGEEEEETFVDLEPEEFEARNDNKQYIEEISNYSAPKETIKMNRYENKPTAILSDKTYVLINRVKCVFGIILAIIMFAELVGTMFILKNKGLIIDNDNTLFIIGFVITGVLALSYILPVMFNPNEHKLNNFKMKYAVLFGILTFLVSLILIYCINTLIGFKLDNFEFFATKLIVPAIMVFNFVILPPIYGLLLKSKKFYD